MDSLFHFIKHALGLCGETHPSLLMGGAGVVGYCVFVRNENDLSPKAHTGNAQTSIVTWEVGEREGNTIKYWRIVSKSR